MKNFMEYMERKTFKREFAAVLLAILVFKIYDGHVEMVQAIVWPILSFVAIAAGLKGYENLAFTTSSSSKPPANK